MTLAGNGSFDEAGAALLAWYDAHARVLPWRAPPDAPPNDPYRVWLAEVMLQQTTVATVTPRYERFLVRYPTAEALAAAPLDDVLSEWAGLGYYARARNLHACAKQVAAEGWPRTEADLRALPGLGAYTAASVAAIAFGERAVVVDGNVERVAARLIALDVPVREATSEVRAVADALTPDARPGDHAQAMMDLGATVCRPKNPACLVCPLAPWCQARAANLQSELPVKPPRKERPTRQGTVFVACRADGAVLCERRPPSGLYGGMAGLPGSDWSEAPSEVPPPLPGDWRAAGEAEHGLTHFRLVLTVMAAETDADAPEGFFWLPRDRRTDLPTVFRRCLDVVPQFMP